MSEIASQPRPDARVVRTHKLLFAGLLDLVAAKRWDKIRVQDILDATGVSRSTFYAHFENKYDLLTSAAPDIVIGAEEGGRPDLLPLFTHVDEMAPVFRPLLTQPVLSEILDTFHRQLAASWATYLSNTRHRDDELLPEMLAGALTAIMRAYAIQDDRDDPERQAARVAAHLNRLIDET